jgi:hypothetical protein
MAKSGFINFHPKKITLWCERSKPDVIKLCIDDGRFVNDEGAKAGMWISIHRSDRNNWNRAVRALIAAGQYAPSLEP